MQERERESALHKISEIKLIRELYREVDGQIKSDKYGGGGRKGIASRLM